jgi:putative membrane protein
MSNGFLGFDASFMLDFVVCALVLVVPVLACSIFAVKFRRNYVLHRNLQLALAVILLLAVSAFEIDMRMHGGWINIINKDPAQPRLTGDALETVRTALYIHMCFAITTPLLWGTTIFLALKRFPNPPQPGDHSRLHKTLGWLSTIDITMTSVTGLVFYYLAFVA